MQFQSLLFLSITALFSCNSVSKSQGRNSGEDQKDQFVSVIPTAPENHAVAAFAEGCFWCSEHIFESVVGVDSAVSGYAGGHTNNPTYEDVNTENTGHAETILVYYNPAIISYAELLNVFFASQDPTTPEQQGPDKGNSYRSIAFYATPEEQQAIDAAKKQWAPQFQNPIVTETLPLKNFFRAENYHQDYIEHNPSNPYVTNVSIPRYKKFLSTYKGKLK